MIKSCMDNMYTYIAAVSIVQSFADVTETSIGGVRHKALIPNSTDTMTPCAHKHVFPKLRAWELCRGVITFWHVLWLVMTHTPFLSWTLLCARDLTTACYRANEVQG